MIKKFEQYYTKDIDTLEAHWEKATFVLDTNVLLNLYRYSPSTRKRVIEILETYKGRYWTPYHVLFEFFSNRKSMIIQTAKAYSNMIKQIDNLLEDLAHDKNHPFIAKKLDEKVKSVLEELKKELVKNQKGLKDRLTDCDILSSIENILEDSIGDELDHTELNKEGKKRYESKIPPGYQDKDQEKRAVERRYGDYKIWQEALDHFKKSPGPVIMVTDDKKDDWFETEGSHTIGARVELLLEFKKETNSDIYIYQSDSFIRHHGNFKKDLEVEKLIEDMSFIRSNVHFNSDRLIPFSSTEQFAIAPLPGTEVPMLSNTTEMARMARIAHLKVAKSKLIKERDLLAEGDFKDKSELNQAKTKINLEIIRINHEIKEINNNIPWYNKPFR